MGMISRNEVKKGDHIYTWRAANIYSHHGIYIDEDTVIHFTPQGGSETKTGSFFHKTNISPTSNDHINPCLKCGNESNPNCSNAKSVVSSCLDCFLAGGNLYLFEYKVTWASFVARSRGGTCTTLTSDSPEEVVYRAKYLLEHNGFGEYNLLKNNCEDFATYCKTSLLLRNRKIMGGSGQVNSVVGIVLGLLSSYGYGVRSEVKSTISNILHFIIDIGTRKDIVKVSVEDLVDEMIARK